MSEPRGFEFTSEKKDDGWGGWSRFVKVCDQEYKVGVQRGKPVRIPYKPRGQNRGFKWNGFVSKIGYGIIWQDEVQGSTGAKGLLEYAGVI